MRSTVMLCHVESAALRADSPPALEGSATAVRKPRPYSRADCCTFEPPSPRRLRIPPYRSRSISAAVIDLLLASEHRISSL